MSTKRDNRLDIIYDFDKNSFVQQIFYIQSQLASLGDTALSTSQQHISKMSHFPKAAIEVTVIRVSSAYRFIMAVYFARYMLALRFGLAC